LLVVNFDPADASALATFRSVYSITNVTIPILGPYSGKLSNRSDRIAIEKPQFPDLPGDPYSWEIVDEVIYGNQNPWPTNANGEGFALERIASSRSGNDPANWVGSVPGPGIARATPLDSDGDGLPDVWETRYGLDPANPRDAAEDADGDGISNLAEFRSGTDPRDPTSFLGFDQVASDGGIVNLQFTAQADRSYTVQFLPEASGTLWQKLADVPAGLKRPITVPDQDSDGYAHRFYRLVTPSLP
jgi:hypothetical protein